jgi:hypothetical protein
MAIELSARLSSMLGSNPARRLARLLAVLLAVLLCWQGLSSSAATESVEFSELREADDSKGQDAILDLRFTTASALGSEGGGHRIATLARRDPHVPLGHAQLERQRGPPSFDVIS